MADTPRDAPPARAPLELLAQVAQTIEARKEGLGMTNAQGKSYVRSLLERGPSAINAKITEEAGELCEAIAGESDARVLSEAADLLFHMMVGLSQRELDLAQVAEVLRARMGLSGIDEKASR